MTSLTKNLQPPTKKFFQMQIRRLAESINTLRAAWFRRFLQKETAVFGCLTNALAPPPIALESSSAAQTDRPV